ncbi:uncharacterized protein LOC110844909 [Folsomia candida]|uniref:DUF243 domain-containing protein n=1 Tax=Folsomia candida TaxID=158441 RepID=A0A226EMR6_FOLCA|nr:uncharacterized protein LOC110844909 [Folsomia candida]OXA58973.1 hypothetical protein Fcan01_04290 [Folsomia candida]
MIKIALIVASFVAVTLARPEPPAAYGVPQYAAPAVLATEYGPGPAVSYGGQVYKHVYVHSAPDEAPEHTQRTIRVPGGGDKHVNIIFVKTPSSSSHQQTEVLLPEQEQQKTVVYVLVKKGHNTADVKIRQPASPLPQKPEVFFIRYKDHQAAPAPVYGPVAVAAPVAVSAPVYGVPQPQGY